MCEHQEAAERSWLPSENGLLKQAPHCELCGTVKNITSDKGKGIGYFQNALARLKKDLEGRKYKVTQAQIRLIIKEFEGKGLADAYWNSFSNQRENFLEIASKYVRINRDSIRDYI